MSRDVAKLPLRFQRRPFPSEAIDSLSSANSLAGDEWRDVASAAELVLPGRCAMSNDHGSVRCLRRNIRVLEISSNVRSPMILTNGLWSVTTSRSLHPCEKYLDCSSPQATARASPSIGA